MKNFKRLLALGLSVAMIAGLTACGSDNGSTPASTNNESNSSTNNESNNASTDDGGSNALYNEGETRTIRLGTWYDRYYDSTHSDVFDNPNATGSELDQMQLDVVKEIEEKYNVRIEWVNLTWEGIQESLNTSVLAGTPDCDLYEVDFQFGIAAALNGFALNMEDILPADSDIFNDQVVMYPMDIGIDNGVYIFNRSNAENVLVNTYMLAYNKQMLDDAGLEDPNALYARGEWTWDKWREYLLALTQDTDGDGVTDVYGYGSRYDFLMYLMLMSNGTGIAMSETENLSSPEVGEVLDFVYNMYNVDHVAYPWNADDFDSNMLNYQDGKTAFWITASWISAPNGYDDASLGFDIVWCPFPVGPSGNQETNATKNVSSGSGYLIPEGVENPELVYNVFYDLTNWYHNDTALRDSDLTWWEDSALTEENYQVMENTGARGGFDMWNALGVEFDWAALLNGEMTAAQFAETYKQNVQDALDGFFK